VPEHNGKILQIGGAWVITTPYPQVFGTGRVLRYTGSIIMIAGQDGRQDLSVAGGVGRWRGDGIMYPTDWVVTAVVPVDLPLNWTAQ